MESDRDSDQDRPDDGTRVVARPAVQEPGAGEALRIALQPLPVEEDAGSIADIFPCR